MTATPSPGALEALCLAGKWRELSRALATQPDKELPALARRRLEARLAAAGHGPLVDLLEAARAHLDENDPAATWLVPLAVERLAARGFLATAEQLRAREIPSARDDGDGAVAATGGDLEAELRAVAEAAELAGRARAARDFAGAARAGASVAARLPFADEAAERRLEAALDAWSALTSESTEEATLGALGALRACRDEESAPAEVRRQAREALDALETEPGRRPSWSFGRDLPARRAGGALSFYAGAFGLEAESEEPPTASHLRARLEALGVHVHRVLLDDAILERALSELEGFLVLEEEQPTRQAYLLVRGFERTGRLVLVSDPAQEGATVRTLGEQWRRAELSGRSALFLTAPGAVGDAARERLAHAGIVDDPRLAAVDRAHFDSRDDDVPHARVVLLAKEAIALAPDIPMTHKRLGEALLALRRLGRSDRDGGFDGWYADTSERFPAAEWPRQLHAEALELARRDPEARVAWADAARLDPGDGRNAHGELRTARRAGHGDQRFVLERALTLDPTQARPWTWMAESRMDQDRPQGARAALDLARELAPQQPLVDRVDALLALRTGDAAGATRLLERACVGPAEEEGQTLLLWRRYWCEARWDDLDALTRRRLTGPLGGVTACWSAAVQVAAARADRPALLEAITEASQRCPVEGALLDDIGDALGLLVPPAELPEVWSQLADRLAGRVSALVVIARQLGTVWGHFAVARRALEQLAERSTRRSPSSSQGCSSGTRRARRPRPRTPRSSTPLSSTPPSRGRASSRRAFPEVTTWRAGARSRRIPAPRSRGSLRT